jgi:hypothetical protein
LVDGQPETPQNDDDGGGGGDGGLIHPSLHAHTDTHSRHDALLRAPGLLPPGDILVHAGDFSTTGTRPQVENFRDFLKASSRVCLGAAGWRGVCGDGCWYASHVRRVLFVLWGLAGAETDADCLVWFGLVLFGFVSLFCLGYFIVSGRAFES